MCPKQQFDRIFPRKREFFPLSLTLSKKLSACSTKFSDRIVKLALYVPGGTHSEKKSKIFFARFWGIRRKTFNLLVEWFGRSYRNSILIFKREISMKIALFDKNVFFPISFPKNQQKMIFQYAFVFRRCFQSCFLPKRGNLAFFFHGRSVIHQWFRRLNENLVAVWETLRAISSKLLFKWPV